MKSCLLITEQFEPTADFLLAELRQRGVPCLRWNLDRFPIGSSISYFTQDGAFSTEIGSDGRRMSLNEVGSIWCRGFRPQGFPENMNEIDARFAQDEAQRTLDGLLTISDVLWMNHPQAYVRANSKPAQLRMATRVGFRIPQTLITNNPDEARDFISRYGGSAIYKTHSQNLNLVPGKAIFTGLLAEKEMQALDLIALTPGIFQELVAKSYEVRVTVVGEKVFGGRIDSQASPETQIDWRHKPYDMEKEPADLPTEIESKIHTLMKAFGLVYGAFDFIVTPENEYVFLEVNPAGQYLWVEANTKMPITAAIVDKLCEPCLG
jgi:glutathione synthase/RimK-type ligase-like ATP-grasp enzyme